MLSRLVTALVVIGTDAVGGKVGFGDCFMIDGRTLVSVLFCAKAAVRLLAF